MKRLWTINGRFLTQPMTGVQRYATQIVCGLDELLSENHRLCEDLEIRLAVPHGDLNPINLKTIRAVRVGRRTGHAWEQTELPGAVENGLLSLCNTGPVICRKQIVCIHDLNTRLAPQSYSAKFRATYRLLLPLLGRMACRVTTVSDFSARMLAEYGVARRDRIDVIPNGHEHVLNWTPRASKTIRPALDGTTVVALGSAAPHKNFRILLDLAEALHARGLRLAVVGAADPRIFQEGQAAGNAVGGDKVLWLGRVADEELAMLLEHALCLAFPSLTEGFGLPPLEAMALGCPVVSSDRASLPEVCGDAVLYADPNRPHDWLAAISQLKDTPSLRERCQQRGRAQARRFSWRSSAEQYAALLARADELDTGPSQGLSDANRVNAQAAA